MNELKIFQSSEFGEIRTFKEADGSVTFCGSDVAKSLGYSNPSKAIIDHCKGITKRETLTAGGLQLLNFITLGFPVIISKQNVKIPKQAFIKFMRGES